MHYSDCLHAKITCCWWVWLSPVRASGQGGGNVGLGYEKLIFAILRLSVIIASGAGMPRCPACRIICGGNEVWNSADGSTGRILFLSMTYDGCAMYIYYDTIWLGLLREAYIGMLLIMWGTISCATYNMFEVFYCFYWSSGCWHVFSLFPPTILWLGTDCIVQDITWIC